jgi:hypothetical protein
LFPKVNYLQLPRGTVAGPSRIIATLLGQTAALPAAWSVATRGWRRATADLRNARAIPAFALVNRETTMPFSLSSYLLGVGTVVGALAFGFGGGVVLTKTAMKDAPIVETRVERVKRADSPSATPQTGQAVEAKAMPAPPAEPAPPAGSPLSQVQASTEPPRPVAEAPKQAEPVRAAESTPQTEPAKPAEQSTKPAEQKEAELRKAEARKIERQKRYAEKARVITMAKAKQRQWEEQPEPSGAQVAFQRPSRPAFAFGREEPRVSTFDIPLFGRSREFSPADRED